MPSQDQSPRNTSDNVDREIAHHIEALTEANIAQGMSPEEARHQALIEFGGREQVKQSVREVHTSAIAESIAFHLKAALRFLRKSPSFSLAVILTLALGIGANSAVFSAIDAIVLRPLPFPNGDRLVVLYQHDSKGRDANRFVAPVRLEDWNASTPPSSPSAATTSTTSPKHRALSPRKSLKFSSLLASLKRSESRPHSAANSLLLKSTGEDRTPFSSATPSGSDASMVIPMRSGKNST
jgi:hypothetical protein